MKSNFIKIHPRDNVVVALVPLEAGRVIEIETSPQNPPQSFVIKESIPAGHKISLTEIVLDQSILKYGYPIGKATRLIHAGEWVHTQNVKTRLSGAENYEYHPEGNEFSPVESSRTFMGYERADGKVGIRNEIWIIPTVGCINEVAQSLSRRMLSAGLPSGIDGVHAYTHPYGCSQLGDDLLNTQKILAALAAHPNAAGVLVLGLGCENNTLKSFRTHVEAVGGDPRRIRYLLCQEAENEVESAMTLISELVETAQKDFRKPISVSKLRIGLKCGGSDGFSGITANPLLGRFSNALIQEGGSTVLTEVPEMFGAEGLFMNRCQSREVFESCVSMLNGFKDYFLRHGQVVYENPSPGNKEGGITTLEEKSLGCLQKGGDQPVVDILPYGGQVQKPGLSFLNAPGNDMVSVTALAAAGAHIVIFTTGRGTPLGGPVPTLKVASNQELALKKKHWIDFNAGALLHGVEMETLRDQLFDKVIAVAGGEKTRNEENGYREIAIFKEGVTL